MSQYENTELIRIKKNKCFDDSLDLCEIQSHKRYSQEHFERTANNY